MCRVLFMHCYNTRTVILLEKQNLEHKKCFNSHNHIYVFVCRELNANNSTRKCSHHNEINS